MATTLIDTWDLTNPDKPTIKKDANAILDYPEDWTSWLLACSDTIATAEAFFPSDGTTLELDHQQVIGGLIVVTWVKGGRLNTTEQCTVRITTVGGRVDDRSMWFKIKGR